MSESWHTRRRDWKWLLHSVDGMTRQVTSTVVWSTARLLADDSSNMSLSSLRSTVLMDWIWTGSIQNAGRYTEICKLCRGGSKRFYWWTKFHPPPAIIFSISYSLWLLAPPDTQDWVERSTFCICRRNWTEHNNRCYSHTTHHKITYRCASSSGRTARVRVCVQKCSTWGWPG